MTDPTDLPCCERPGCQNTVKRRSFKFCSQSCAQALSRSDATPSQAGVSGLDVKGNEATVTKSTYQPVRTLADLVKVCEIDTATWEVERWTCQTQEMGAMPRAVGSKAVGWRRESTAPVVTQLFHVKAWLRRKVLIIGVQEELDALKADAKSRIGRLRDSRPLVRKATGENMLEIGIYDAHFGKLAWGKETGHGNYDLKIAEREYALALETIIARTSGFAFEEIVFVVGNDILNADNRTNQTTAGTPQSSDSRFHKAFGIVRRLATTSVDRLRLIAPVRVVIVPGNHDTMAAWHLGDSLECYYHGQTDVTLDNDPTPRKYHQYGQNMLMWTHGDKGKRSAYPGIMASERPDMWGTTKYREIHVGHHHQTWVDSYPGVQIRTLRALCPADAWHSEQGFVGKLRGAEAFVWHKDEGIVSQTLYTVQEAA